MALVALQPCWAADCLDCACSPAVGLADWWSDVLVLQCAASATFRMEPDHGRSRVFAQVCPQALVTSMLAIRLCLST